MRAAFQHAKYTRSWADPLVLCVELRCGNIGFGETVARRHDTGEDADSVETAIRDVFCPLLAAFHPFSFSEALEFIEGLPEINEGGRLITAARAAVELALLDAYSRHFGRVIGDAVTHWLEFKPAAHARRLKRIRCSGVLVAHSLSSTLGLLRKMRWFGLRDFKLNVGRAEDDLRLRGVAGQLRRGLATGSITLRLDANGAWSLSEALAQLEAWNGLGVYEVEQPLAKGDEQNLLDIKALTNWRLIHDESFVTLADARALVDLGVADCLNIRISKCGGFLPALKLVHFCEQHHIDYMLGCMAGQTSLLSAVERRVLEQVRPPRHVESNYGRYVLRDDVCARSLGFGYGGKLKPLPGMGWGVDIQPQRLERFCVDKPVYVNL